MLESFHYIFQNNRCSIIIVGPSLDLQPYELIPGESTTVEVEFYLTLPVADIHIDIFDAQANKV